MPAKPPFNKAQYEVLKKALQKAKKKFKTQEEMALALEITQPSLSSLLAWKWKPGVKIARAIANLNGVTLEELVGEFSEGAAAEDDARHDLTFANLDVCIRFYAAEKHWSPWTIAAARAGIFGTDDFAPPKWHEKLDMLENRLSTFRRGDM